MKTIVIIVPMVPPSPNELRRKYRHPHAYKKLRDKWAEAIYYMTPVKERKALETYSRMYRMMVRMMLFGMREYDPDNVAGAQKPVLDALKNIHFIHDDSREWLVLVPPSMFRTSRKNIRTIIEITIDFTEDKSVSSGESSLHSATEKPG